ncbi:hypothetical protein VNO80_07885 [Phaseolus coccineus]|uniref:Uncharacterized protein n=1 Tax=Phaseolus coccineus TaxID=3886 RepID=A0AAN9NKZ3_PHACN
MRTLRREVLVRIANNSGLSAFYQVMMICKVHLEGHEGTQERIFRSLIKTEEDQDQDDDDEFFDGWLRYGLEDATQELTKADRMQEKGTVLKINNELVYLRVELRSLHEKGKKSNQNMVSIRVG